MNFFLLINLHYQHHFLLERFLVQIQVKSLASDLLAVELWAVELSWRSLSVQFRAVVKMSSNDRRVAHFPEAGHRGSLQDCYAVSFLTRGSSGCPRREKFPIFEVATAPMDSSFLTLTMP